MIELEPTDTAGRVPYWTLRFFDADHPDGSGDGLLTVDQRGHVASVTLSLEEGLRPGQVEIDLARLSDTDYGTLVSAGLPSGLLGAVGGALGLGSDEAAAPRPLYVSVSLFWRSGWSILKPDYDADKVIDIFKVNSMSRSVSGLEVMTKIKGELALYSRLRTATTETRIEAASSVKRAVECLKSAGFSEGTDFKAHPHDSESDGEISEVEGNTKILDALRKAGKQMQASPPYHRGRALFLLDNGVLHFGAGRPIPRDGAGSIKTLDGNTGLIEPTKGPQVSAVPKGRAVLGEDPVAQRQSWTLKSAGRRDIKPGDIVTFEKPAARSADFGGFGLPSPPAGLALDGAEQVHLYVTGIRHQFSGDVGWLTHVDGLETPGENLETTAWDIFELKDNGPAGLLEDISNTSGASQKLVGAIEARINKVASVLRNSAVAEVRAFNTETKEAAGQVTQAGQSQTVLRGLKDDGGARLARRAEILRDGNTDIKINTPYVTSFAWGRFGHVLPRYPGMRVLTLNNGNDSDDPVEIGTLWQSKSGADTPLNTEMGDWWLILPAHVAKDPVAAAPSDDTSAIAPPADAKAAQDLITAKGERSIAVNGFTIRAFQGEALPGPDTRPALPDDGGILIEQADGGAKIRILKDGTVEISGGAITIEASDKLTLRGKGVDIVTTGGEKVDVKNG